MNFIKSRPFFFLPAILIQDFFSQDIIKEKVVGDWKSCLTEIRKNGVALAPISMDPQFINDAKKDIDNLITRSEKFGTDYRIFDIEKESHTINTSFSNNPELTAITRAYVRSKPTLQTTLGAKLTYAPENLGSGQGWHRDSYTKQFKAMVYLSDVTLDTGPFEYVLGSHTYRHVFGSVMDNNDKNLRANNSRFEHSDVVEFCKKRSLERKVFDASAGAIVLFDSRGLHRGSPILSGHRYALTNYYV
jgi:ectoine hydroxylase-related dioxygenase (phytanoyl-CoA dioxygenase family)